MSDDGKMTVHRTIDASAADIFDVLSNPKRHPELDGSGFIRSDEKAERIKAVGDVFRMNMEGPHMGGEYQTDNTVSGFDHNKLIAWKTAPADTDPPGWEWLWELDPQGPESTDVTLTYDWSKVTDKKILSLVSFPLISEGELEDSLGKLASSVSS
ncbi:MAG: polyketide cyclase [Humibacillus sp.]|nr:polyketide cyclase [Humibacillus sp.]MDN5779877.1 polyketide cyclase [Humibacillus sp.]